MKRRLLQRKLLQIRTRNDIKVSDLPPPEHFSWIYVADNGTNEAYLDVIGMIKLALRPY